MFLLKLIKMNIYNKFTPVFIYLLMFIPNNLCIATTCYIYLNSVHKLCIEVYNISWNIPWDNKISINLCDKKESNCTSITHQDINGYPIPIQPEGRNYTIKVGFHCNSKRNVIFDDSDNNTFMRVPSANCAKNCLYNIQSNLQIDLTSIQTLSTKIDDRRYYFQICQINAINNCGNSMVSCIIDYQKNKTSPLGDNNNWEVFYYGVEKGLQLVLHASHKLHFIIQMNCDPNFSQPPKFSFVRKKGKRYLFNLISNKLCVRLPLKYNTGVETQLNYLYDVSELKDQNWKVSLPDQTVIIFTVGDSIQDDKYLNFGDRNIFACRNTTDKCISLGSVTTGLTFDNNNLQVLYTNGDMCQNGELTSLRIQFLCSNKQNQPQLLNFDKNNSCFYDIIWKTSVGCPHAIGKLEDCSVYDNVASLTHYNFNSLKNRNEDYELELPNSYLRINLCDRLIKSCGQTIDTSLCLEKTDGLAISFGPVNKHPSFRDGKIELLYSSNEKCDLNLNYTARLHMVCNTIETRNNALTVVKEMNEKNDNCEINLEWRTNLACYRPQDQYQISCNVQGVANLNLHKLIRTENNYEIPYKNTIFILNICKPVIFNENAFYSGLNPGVIMVDNTDANVQTKTKILGNIVSEPIYDPNSKSIKMEYSNNLSEKCILYFYCNRNNKIPDIHVKINKNNYNFIIFTNETCMENNEDIDVNSILNQFNDSILDHVIEVPSMSTEISPNKINCSIVSKMNNFKIKTLLMDYSDNEMQQLTYDIENHSKVENIFENLRAICNKLIWNTTQHLVFNNVHEFNINQQGMNIELKLFCNYTAEIGIPKLIESLNPNYVYHWYSTIFCPKMAALYNSSTLIIKNPILHRDLDLKQLLGLDSSKEIVKAKLPKTESIINFKAAKYNSILNYQDNVVQFDVYNSNDGCFNQNSTTRFNLICDLEKTTFEVKQKTKCLIEFDWYIRDVCYLLGLESTLIHSKNLPNFNSDNDDVKISASASTSLIFKIFMALFLIALCSFCLFIYKKRYYLVLTGTARRGAYVQVRWENESI